MGARNITNTATYFKLRAKTSDTDPAPYFGRQVKHGDKYEITEKYNAIDGILTEISCESYQFEGDTKWKCKMLLKDAVDSSSLRLESNFNNLLYGILNSFANTEDFGVTITVWLGKERDNGKQYPGASVMSLGTSQKVGWKFGADEIPKPKQVPVPGTKKTILDDENVIAFWARVIVDINNRLRGTIQPVSPFPPNVMDGSLVPPAGDPHNDLPF